MVDYHDPVGLGTEVDAAQSELKEQVKPALGSRSPRPLEFVTRNESDQCCQIDGVKRPRPQWRVDEH